MDKWLNEYKKKIGDPIPLMQIMGNDIFEKQFGGSPEAVYEYCVEHGKTWEEVLKYEFDPDCLY